MPIQNRKINKLEYHTWDNYSNPQSSNFNFEGSLMSNDKIVITVDADLEDLIPGFLENRARELETLRAAIRDGNFQSLQSIGHSMKGVGGGYGFDGITDIGRDLESAAKVQDLEGINALIEKYGDYLERIEVKFE